MKKSKIIPVCMAAIMVASSIPIPAFAASIGSNSADTSVGADTNQNVQTQYEEIAPSDTQTQVYLSVNESDLIVSLPTTVILSGTPNEKGQYIGNYSVGVNGEMSGNKIVKIIPDENIELKQKGKENQTATISQKQMMFSYNDFKNNTKTTGTVTAEKLSAGSWNSSFNFNVSTIDDAVPDGYTLLYKYDLSATPADNVAAFYCVPNENVEPVQLNQENSINTSSDTATETNNDKVIIYNGVKYILSDKDKLVITGTGDMKENIADELINWEKLYQLISDNVSLLDWTKHYSIPKNKGFRIVSDDEFNESVMWGKQTDVTISKNPRFIEFNYLGWKSGKGWQNYDAMLRFGNNSIFPDIAITSPSNNPTYSKKYSSFSKLQNQDPDVLAQKVLDNNYDTEYTGNAYYAYVIQYIKSIENDICVTIPREVEIQEGVTNISKSAFYNENRLTKVTIPSSVKTIDERAFYGCSGLKEINLPAGVENIEEYAFAGSLPIVRTKVTIPGSVKTIKSNAFAENSIDNLFINEGVETIEDNAFNYVENCHLAKSVKNYGSLPFVSIKNFYYNGTLDDYMNITLIPTTDDLEEVTYDYENANFPLSRVRYYNNGTSSADDKCEVYFNNVKYDLNNFVIPASITTIPKGIFANTCNISNIKFAGEITTIDEYAFYNFCKTSDGYCRTTNIYLPSSISKIGNNAFTSFGGNQSNLYLYCQSQSVADLFVNGTNNDSVNKVIVDATKF